jgi:SnoaL-like domain
MDVRLSTVDQQEIEDLLTEFFWRLDHGQAEQVSELFLAHGRLDTGDRPPLQGHAALKEMFAGRPPGIVTRHVWSCLRLQSVKPNTVVASFLSVTHARFGDPSLKSNISDVTAEFERDPSQSWRIATMQLSTVFLIDHRAP